MKIKTFYLLIPIGLFLLSAFSPICAEEKKIPLSQSEKELLEQSRIETQSPRLTQKPEVATTEDLVETVK